MPCEQSESDCDVRQAEPCAESGTKRAQGFRAAKAAATVVVMRRKPRAFFAGIYHVGSHGSDDRHLFLSDAERSVFPDGLSRALQHLHTWYSRLHNKLHARTGHLFRAHPFAREIESDDDLLTVASYLACNPIEAGLAVDPFDWPWSSVPATAGLARPRIPLHLAPIRDALGGGPSWHARYADRVAASPLRLVA